MSLFDYYRNEYLHELSVNGNNVDDNDDFNVDDPSDNDTDEILIIKKMKKVPLQMLLQMMQKLEMILILQVQKIKDLMILMKTMKIILL